MAQITLNVTLPEALEALRRGQHFVADDDSDDVVLKVRKAMRLIGT